MPLFLYDISFVALGKQYMSLQYDLVVTNFVVTLQFFLTVQARIVISSPGTSPARPAQGFGFTSVACWAAGPLHSDMSRRPEPVAARGGPGQGGAGWVSK